MGDFGPGHRSGDAGRIKPPREDSPYYYGEVKVGGEDVGDRLMMALLFWAFFVVVSIFLILIAILVIHLPERKFPKKRPLWGCLPWSIVGRLLGYGFIHWENGEAQGPWDFIRERHDILSIFFGDKKFIATYLRVFKFTVGLCTIFVMNTAYADAEGERESIDVGDEVGSTILSYTLTISASIFVTIACRLTIIATSQLGEVWSMVNAGFFVVMQAGMITLAQQVMYLKMEYYELTDEEKASTLNNYLLNFLYTILIVYLVQQPILAVIVWHIGTFLYEQSEDHWTIGDLFDGIYQDHAVTKAARKFKEGLARFHARGGKPNPIFAHTDTAELAQRQLETYEANREGSEDSTRAESSRV